AGDLAAIGDQQRFDHGAHIRNTPKRACLGKGAFSVAAKASPSTSRVCAGSITPSSHSRAVAYQGLPSASYLARIGALNASNCSADQFAASALTVASTDAAGSPPITEIRLFGQENRKRGE